MIKDPPLLRIRRRFARPSKELLGRFAGVPTGYLVDAMGGRGCLDYRIKPLAEPARVMVGPAVTCHAGPADNLALFGALAVAGQGDILVAAIGRAGMITHEFVKPGATVIDVGMNKVTDPEEFRKFFAGNTKREETFRKKGSTLVGDVHP